MEFDLEYPLMASLEDSIPGLFALEMDHMPTLDFNASESDHPIFDIRREAFSLISGVHYCYELNPFTTYLAANYIDRFISRRKIREKKRWIIGILAISSLSLAAKMTNIDISISLSNLQREEGFAFQPRTIHRMEALILTTLSWRMRSITPFSFLNYFISLFKIQESSSLTTALKLGASDIIFNSHHEMKLLEFKPSLIAASALLYVAKDLIPEEFSSFRDAILFCEHVKKEKLVQCLEVMQELELPDNSKKGPESDAATSCTLIPSSVLQRCTSSESESDRQTDKIKRRRLNHFCSDHSLIQISQIQPC